MNDQNTPSADDLATPVLRFVVAGVAMNVVRPYWAQRPNLSPPLPGSAGLLRAARWLDGAIAAVPTGANLDALALFYTGAKVVAELQRDLPAELGGAR